MVQEPPTSVNIEGKEQVSGSTSSVSHDKTAYTDLETTKQGDKTENEMRAKQWEYVIRNYIKKYFFKHVS